MIIYTKAYEAGQERRNPVYSVKDSRSGDVLNTVHFRKTVVGLLAKYRTQGLEVHCTMRDKLGRLSYPNL